MDSQATVSERLAYPVRLQSLSETVLVSFPDVPEALTEGDTEQDALNEAYDCLVATLAGYIHAEWASDTEDPSAAHGHSPRIELSPIVTAKLALYRAMREQHAVDRRCHSGKAAWNHGEHGKSLARLGLVGRSHIDHVAAALDVLGKRLVVAVRRIQRLESRAREFQPRPFFRRQHRLRICSRRGLGQESFDARNLSQPATVGVIAELDDAALAILSGAIYHAPP